jgi:hypothetical protein
MTKTILELHSNKKQNKGSKEINQEGKRKQLSS